MKSLLVSTLLFNVFAYFTIIIRPKIYRVTLFKPMIRNLKLSLIPFVVLLITISFTLGMRYVFAITQMRIILFLSNITFVFGSIIWIALLPNATYLLTELNLTHRDMDEYEVPIWYDIISVTSFALSGILNTMLNIMIVQLGYLVIIDPIIIQTRDQVLIQLSAVLIILGVVIGIYLGREVRFNSWDLLHPKMFFIKLREHFSLRGRWKNFLYFVVFHLIFLLLIYNLLGLNNAYIFFRTP
ncbi:DUF1361 domain-containing protein [Erysipelothrix amsterdamensis]|uniref:DUF1361 domain-containing protein n=1 Tax=Erysipelothrix amsterdamensis TaxID=2929157 RepID=A0AAU9VDP5_9FIRM|nr:DUF1361 domain-containing protein [Erysipelothrix rhusiopathiae]CAH2760413.1 DUF1361 domain-containing protein [Erysipelothrix sp. A18Y020d]CAH2763704.1 DUF1361 domain-containing protein [Erysipelothrix sp. A18Y020d]